MKMNRVGRLIVTWVLALVMALGYSAVSFADDDIAYYEDEEYDYGEDGQYDPEIGELEENDDGSAENGDADENGSEDEDNGGSGASASWTGNVPYTFDDVMWLLGEAAHYAVAADSVSGGEAVDGTVAPESAVAEALTDARSASAELADAADSGDVKVVNIVASPSDGSASLSSDLAANGIDAASLFGGAGSGSNLVLNIDAANCSSYRLDGFSIDGGTASSVAEHIVVNLVERNGDGSFSTFSGSVTTSGTVAGTILAPSAAVAQGGTVVGAVIASAYENAGSTLTGRTIGEMAAPEEAEEPETEETEPEYQEETEPEQQEETEPEYQEETEPEQQEETEPEYQEETEPEYQEETEPEYQEETEPEYQEETEQEQQEETEQEYPEETEQEQQEESVPDFIVGFETIFPMESVPESVPEEIESAEEVVSEEQTVSEAEIVPEEETVDDESPEEAVSEAEIVPEEETVSETEAASEDEAAEDESSEESVPESVPQETEPDEPIVGDDELPEESVPESPVESPEESVPESPSETPVPIPATVKKAIYARVNISGRDWKDGDSFTVDLAPVSAEDRDGNAIDVPMPKKTTIKITEHERTSFGRITFTQPGTYTYTITQRQGKLKYMEYDTEPHTAVVLIEESEDGTELTASVTYDQGNWSQQITNTYKKPATGTAQIKVRKFLVGRDWQSGDSFSFRISAEDGTPMPVDGDGETVLKIKVTSNEPASFGKIKFTQPGEYVYTVNETIPKGAVDNGDGTYTKGGITYDATKHRVVVTMTDNGEGKLVPSYTYDGESADYLIVTNSYDASGSKKIYVAKTIVGRRWQEGDSFTFDLAAASATNGNGESITIPMPENSTVTVASSEPATFGAIRFTEPGVYTYRITERKGNLKGMSYDTEPHTVMIAVTDRDGSGKLSASISYEGGGTAQRITNIYTPDTLRGTGEIFVQTRLVGRDWRDTDSFSFRIVAGNSEDFDGNAINTPMPELTTITVADENPTGFGTITFSKPGTYRYKIGQAVPSDSKNNGDGTYTKNGMTYDAAAHTVVATVVNNGNGKLDVSFTYDNGTNAQIITNTYSTNGRRTFSALTGDTSPIALYVVLLAAAAAVVIWLLVRGRRKK